MVGLKPRQRAGTAIRVIQYIGISADEALRMKPSRERWTDDLPEDGELPGWLEDALKALNKVIAAHKDDPLSWSAGG